MKLKGLVLLVAGVLLSTGLNAAEVRIVRFRVQPDFGFPTCQTTVGWDSETFFHNSTDVSQTVRFLEVSNGSPSPSPRPLVVPAHQTVKIYGYEPLLGWDPVPGTTVWVNRLDVPAGVIIANRVASGVTYASTPEGGCAGHVTVYAGLPLPVFRSLVPAGSAQYFLGTDVGSDQALDQRDARLNVGVFNAGSESGTAVVHTYCGLVGPSPSIQNSLVSTEQFAVPAGTVVQKTVLPSTLTAGCPTGGTESFWYATVTVDQPSFAYAIGLANGTLPTFPGLTYTGN